MFDRRIGRILGFVVGIAMLAGAAALASRVRVDRDQIRQPVDQGQSRRNYEERMKQTERLLFSGRL